MRSPLENKNTSTRTQTMAGTNPPNSSSGYTFSTHTATEAVDDTLIHCHIVPTPTARANETGCPSDDQIIRIPGPIPYTQAPESYLQVVTSNYPNPYSGFLPATRNEVQSAQDVLQLSGAAPMQLPYTGIPAGTRYPVPGSGVPQPPIVPTSFTDTFAAAYGRPICSTGTHNPGGLRNPGIIARAAAAAALPIGLSSPSSAGSPSSVGTLDSPGGPVIPGMTGSPGNPFDPWRPWGEDSSTDPCGTSSSSPNTSDYPDASPSPPGKRQRRF